MTITPKIFTSQAKKNGIMQRQPEIEIKQLRIEINCPNNWGYIKYYTK